jgi:WD40 repeat protein
MEVLMNKYLVIISLLLGITSSQATQLYIAFEDASGASVEGIVRDAQEYGRRLPKDYAGGTAQAYEQRVAPYLDDTAHPVGTYDHMRLTFKNEDTTPITYTLPYDAAKELAPKIHEIYAIPVDEYIDLADPKYQQIFLGLDAESVGLIVRMNADGRDADTLKFTQESLNKFINRLLEAGKPVLGCTTPLTLALKLAVVLRSGLHSPVGNQLLELALTDDYLKMQKPEDLTTNLNLIKNLGEPLYGQNPIYGTYNNILVPFWILLKEFEDFRKPIWSPNGRYLAGLARTADIHIWNPANTTEPTILPGRGHYAGDIAWSPDGNYMANAENMYNIHIWDLKSNTLLKTLSIKGYLWYKIAWSPNGRYLAVGAQNDRDDYRAAKQDCIHIWDVGNGTLLKTLITQYEIFSWAPNSRYLATNINDSDIGVWDVSDVRNSALLHTLVDPSITDASGVLHGWPTALAWSPDSRYLALGNVMDDEQKSNIRVWNALEGTLVHTFDAPSRRIKALAWSPNGRYLAGGIAPYVNVWDMETVDLLPKFRHDDVRSLTWSPDGRYLASGSSNGNVLIQDLKDYYKIKVAKKVSTFAINYKTYLDHLIDEYSERRPIFDMLVEYHGPDFSVEWSPDGRSLLATLPQIAYVFGAEEVFDNLIPQEQWQMIVRNAYTPFNNYDEARAAAREITAARTGSSSVSSS